MNTTPVEAMPLVAALMRNAKQHRTSWHMPGHAGGNDFPDWLQALLTRLDVTELPATDDINQPTGPALEAMSLAAKSFGAGLTRFITGGSTTGLQILLAAAVGRGGILLLPRSVHQSVVHIAALMDFDLRWIEADAESDQMRRFSLLPQVTPSTVSTALAANPGCRAVLLTSPDYYGYCADIRTIAKIVHRHDALLLVDEAHGAHFTFGTGRLPPAAMSAGADACVQSGHKTLPVLTPGAYLHVSIAALDTGRLTANQINRMLPVFQTSSPSFPIAATLDYARAWLDRGGSSAIDHQLSCLEGFRKKLLDKLLCSPQTFASDSEVGLNRDPLRVVLRLEEGISHPSARDLAMALSDEGIDIEFYDLNRLVLIPSLRQPTLAWQTLADTLNRLVSGSSRDSCNRTAERDAAWRNLLKTAPEAVLTPGDVLFGRHRQILVSPSEAVGRVSARTILPYPPGIPLVWPGERLDKYRVDFLTGLMENKVSITGIDQRGFWVLS